MGLMVDRVIKQKVLEQMETDQETLEPMLADLHDYGLFVLDPKTKHAFMVGWSSGFAAAHAMTRTPDGKMPSPVPDGDENAPSALKGSKAPTHIDPMVG